MKRSHGIRGLHKPQCEFILNFACSFRTRFWEISNYMQEYSPCTNKILLHLEEEI